MSIQDYIKPLKLEIISDFDFFPTETDPSEDGIIAAGYAIGSSGLTIERDTNSNLKFKDPVAGAYTLFELAGGTQISQSSIEEHMNNTNIHYTQSEIIHSNLQGLSYIDSGHIDFQRDGFEYSSAPTVNNDGIDTAGLGRIFEESDMWIVSKDDIYINVDNTTASSIWKELAIGGGEPMYIAQCGYQGQAKSNYLQFFSNIPSSDTPFVIATESSLRELSVSIKTWSTAGTFSFYIKVNGITVYTINLIYPDMLLYTSGLLISLNAGDKISVECSGGAANVQYPILSLFIKKG